MSKYNPPLPAVVAMCFDSQVRAVLGRFALFVHEGDYDLRNQMRS